MHLSSSRPAHRRTLRLLAAPAVAAALLAGGCSSGDDAAPTTSAAPRTTAVPTTAPGNSIRGERYCEVLLVQADGGTLQAEVYNSFPLNDCPEAKWSQLDPAAIAQTAGARAAVLNGPRFWLMDTIDKDGDAADLPRSTFGGIEMYQQATVDVSSMASAKVPYRENSVDRKTVFVFDAGQTVYELVAPDGTTYVMQTWSQQVDPTLAEADLAGLGTRLQLPAGWTYRSRTLGSTLKVDTTNQPARVVQDDLGNSYSRVAAG